MTNEITTRLIQEASAATGEDFFSCRGTKFPEQLKDILQELFDWAFEKAAKPSIYNLSTYLNLVYQQLDRHRSRSGQGDKHNSPCPEKIEDKKTILTTHADSIDFMIANYQFLTENDRPRVTSGLFEYTELLYACMAKHLMLTIKKVIRSIPKYPE